MIHSRESLHVVPVDVGGGNLYLEASNPGGFYVFIHYRSKHFLTVLVFICGNDTVNDIVNTTVLLPSLLFVVQLPVEIMIGVC